jgi:hypothetical protein
MQYLNAEQYYIDLYDLWTIKDCLDVIKTFREIYQKMLSDEKLKDTPKEEPAHWGYKSTSVMKLIMLM